MASRRLLLTVALLVAAAPSAGAVEPKRVMVFGDSVAWTLVTYLPSHPELDVRDHTLMGCGISRTAPSATSAASTRD